MTQEGKEKELLLQDLCAKLYYKVKVQYKGAIKEVQYIEPEFDELCFIYPDNSFTVPVADCKPYLRPLSSMTKEEINEFEQITDNLLDNGTSEEIWNTVIDWLNAHHFDHRGLIGKGLAIEAPNDMYKT
jgi:hypothetical protein